MRHVKLLTAGLAMAVCAACIAAVPAMAETGHFHAWYQYKHALNEEHPAVIKGLSLEEQEWTFGAVKGQLATGYHIVCNKANAFGKMTEPFTEELTLTVRFSKCHVIYFTRFGQHVVKNEYPARFDKEGITLVYHNNGFVEALGGESGEEVEYVEGRKIKLLPVAATWTLPGHPEPDCIIQLPEQTIPAKAIKDPNGTFSAATYANEKQPIVSKKYPLGYKERLIITNEFKTLKFVATGGKCAEESENHQGNRGTYAGNFNNEVTAGGNIGFE